MQPNDTTHLASVETSLHVPALGVVFAANSEVNSVKTILLALVEDVVDVVGEDTTFHARELFAGVVAQPDGSIVGARHAGAFSHLSATDGAQAPEIVLTLNEGLAFLIC